MRQISVFRLLSRDCAKLRDRILSWIVSKGRAAVFLSYVEAEASVKSQELSEFQKVCAMSFTNFTIFRLRDHRILKIVSQSRAVALLALIKVGVTHVPRFFENRAIRSQS